MRYFTDLEILRSICLSILFGIFLSCLYVMSRGICHIAKKILALPCNVLKLVSKFTLRKLKTLTYSDNIISKNCKVNHVYDAIIFSIFGILYVLHTYVTLDGEFRLYILLISVFSFYLFTRTAGNILYLTFKRVFEYIYSCGLLLFGVAILPMYKTLKFITLIIYKHIEPIKQKHLLRKSKIITSKKLSEVRNLMESKDIISMH